MPPLGVRRHFPEIATTGHPVRIGTLGDQSSRLSSLPSTTESETFTVRRLILSCFDTHHNSVAAQQQRRPHTLGQITTRDIDLGSAA